LPVTAAGAENVVSVHILVEQALLTRVLESDSIAAACGFAAIWVFIIPD